MTRTRAWVQEMQQAMHFGPVPPACQAAQTAVVRARIRALSPLISILVIGWIPIDLIELTRIESWRIFPLRLAFGAAMLGLWRWSPRLSAGTALQLFVWLQALGFGAMQLSLQPDEGGVLRVGYGLFPFVLTAQLAVFPLPWRATGLLAVAALALLLVTSLADPIALGLPLLNDLWLLGLILAVTAWASNSQLGLLVDLLGARQAAAHDGLTGLVNRRSAEELLDSEHARATRLGEPLSVLMIDLDHFKRINDGWGHACGDEVLKATARQLGDALRANDVCARYGGEEFLAILPTTGAAAALEVGERIRKRIASMEVACPCDSMRVTTSIGIATLKDAEPLMEMVARADAALYRAKSAGRNRCEQSSTLDGSREPLLAATG